MTVSELLELIFPNDYKDIPPYILEKAKQRGIEVHDWLEKKTYVSLENMIYIENLKTILDDFVFLEFEKSVSNDWLRGRYDFICEYKGKKYIGDLKTSTSLNLKKVELQTTCYKYLNDDDSLGQLCIHVTKKGVKVHILDYRIDIIEKARCIYEYKRK